MSEWKEYELKDVFEFVRNGSTNTQVDFITNYPVSRIETISNGQIDYNKIGYVESISDDYLINQGDILLSHINSVKHIGKVAFKRDSRKLYHGMNLLLLRTKTNYNTNFIYYKLVESKEHFERIANQAINQASINQTEIQKTKIKIPKLIYQNKIADILSVVEDVIEQTQAAIEKYKAIKQGMLHDLFTRGLTASGQLRPTPQQAPELYKQSELGLIPKEWEVKKLGEYLISLEAGVSVNSTDTSTTDDVAVLKTSAVFNGTFNPNENKKVITKDIERVKTNPKADSIIISRMNTPMLVGECGYVDRDYPLLFLPDRLWQTVFLDKNVINVRWVNYLLNTENFSKTIKDSATGTSDSMKNITKDVFFNLRIPYIPIVEQNNNTEKLISIDTKLQSEEALLSKYQSIKKGLMSDLLSGKKRVVVKEEEMA